MIKEIAHFPLASVVIMNGAISLEKTHDYAEFDPHAGKSIIHIKDVDAFIASIQQAKYIIEQQTAYKEPS